MFPATTCSPVTPVERARALIGTPFRLHGRDIATGLDCVGLIATVFDQCDVAPTGYALRGGSDSHWQAVLDQLAIRRKGSPLPGDIILCLAGPAQYHLGLWSGDGLIHADAATRRVVETPGPLRWPLIAAWHDCQER